MSGVLVIGGSGTVGRQVLSQLQVRGGAVRALMRNPEKERLPPGVEVVRGDLSVPESIEPALKGIDAVFLTWTAPTVTVEAVLERIAKQAQRIVFLSSPYKTEHPLFQKPQPNAIAALHSDIEGRIARSGLEWTFLRPGMFATNALTWWAPQIRAGDVVRWPYLAAQTAPIDEHDVAAVAVRALCDDGHAGAEYVLTGSESLSQVEQVLTVGRAIGRSLHVEEIRPEQARTELFGFWPSPVADMLLRAWAAAIGLPAFVTSMVAEITGAPARTFLEWATHHGAEFLA
jgi:uncharacterized protein YbjT (DUF2867 family)